jgi:hypothetical protein
MKHQKQKLYLHELCAHEGFKNLNSWSEKGYFLELTLAWPLSQILSVLLVALVKLGG